MRKALVPSRLTLWCINQLKFLRTFFFYSLLLFHKIFISEMNLETQLYASQLITFLGNVCISFSEY